MSGDDHGRQSSCEGKERFTSAKLARLVAHRSRGYGKTNRAREAYRCEFCTFWHVGTPVNVRRRRR